MPNTQKPLGVGTEQLFLSIKVFEKSCIFFVKIGTFCHRPLCDDTSCAAILFHESTFTT